jgi:hypothetical protein
MCRIPSDLVQILSRRLSRKLKTRRWLRMRLATGFELTGEPARHRAIEMTQQHPHDAAFTARNSPLPTGTRQVANKASAVTNAMKGAISSM